MSGFGGMTMATVTTKVANNSVSLLIGKDLCKWEPDIVQEFAPDVSVYRMVKLGSIELVSPEVPHWEAGRKVLIALNLMELYPLRSKAIPHAT